MKILILTDGDINNGGYSTLGHIIYRNIKNKYHVNFYTFILTNKPMFKSHEIYIENCNNDNLIYSNLNSKFNKNYNIVICTSPWAFYISSLFFNEIRTIYVKGGGMKTDNYISNLSDTFILDTDIDNYFDILTINLERKATINLIKYIIIPTTHLLYQILMKGLKYKFIRDKLIKSINFAWFYSSKKKNNIDSDKKKYDLIFVINNHNRIVKNSQFVYRVFETNPQLKKIVIGLNCEHYNTLSNTIVINKCIENENVKKLLKKSRILLAPSYYDSGPSTIIEALQEDCKPICFYNCGFGNCDIGCVTLDNLNLDLWNKKINYLLSVFDNIELFFYKEQINNFINNDINFFCDKFIEECF